MWRMKQFHAYSKTVTIKKSFISFIVSRSGTLKFKPAIQSHFIHLWFLFSIFSHFPSPDTLFNLRSFAVLCPGSLNFCRLPCPLTLFWVQPLWGTWRRRKLWGKSGVGNYLLFWQWLPFFTPTAPICFPSSTYLAALS